MIIWRYLIEIYSSIKCGKIPYENNADVPDPADVPRTR